MLFTDRNSPRWLVFFLDLLICTFSLILAYFLRFNFNLPDIVPQGLQVVIPVYIGVRGLTFLIGRTYQGIVRYTSLRDFFRILAAVTTGSAVLLVINLVSLFYFSGSFLIPMSVILIDLIAAAYLMTSLRLVVKFIYQQFARRLKSHREVLIFGSSEPAVLVKRALDLDQDNHYRILGFIENDRRKTGKKLEGIHIYDADDLPKLLKKWRVTDMIIASPSIAPSVKRNIIQQCLNRGVEVKTVPGIKSWLDFELRTQHLKNIRIEDLLEREPIILSNHRLGKVLKDKTILVTGAAGSIGGEIVRQLTRFPVGRILLVDRAETPLHGMEVELERMESMNEYTVALADITDPSRMEEIFSSYRPHFVVHAAAYKHVPMVESNPVEAVKNNILGTRILADLSMQYQAEKFIMISTDKAVNPTNVMGATKRVAELYTQSLNGLSSTSFIATRFGNVLGSNGSVIPRFREQIEKGGPVTVTHPGITRFFMTITEACQLVLEAGCMGNGGDIFVFDMGEQVSIVNLARNMIRLSGYEPDKDIQIRYIGLRPGEKMHEELLYPFENHLPTHHPKIMIAESKRMDPHVVNAYFDRMEQMVRKRDEGELIRLLREMVPTFKSSNPAYQVQESIH